MSVCCPNHPGGHCECGHTYYIVAIKWRDGYGGGRRVDSIEDGEKEASKLIAQGYGDPNRCPIHIIKHREPEVVRTITKSTKEVRP